MSRIAVTAAVLVLAQATASTSLASDRCISRDDMTSLRIAAFQQQLMVAALTCDDADSYNDFVRSHRPELMSSDHAMLDLFQAKDGSSGDAEYNAFKTRLANLASMRSVRHSYAFCRNAERAFDDAAADDSPLSDVVWSEPISARMPFEACDDDEMMTADASEHHFHYHHIHWRTRYTPED